MPFITTAREVYWILAPHIDWNVEEAWVLALNSQLSLIRYKLLAKGTVDRCLLHPRDIFRFLIAENANSFILAHNHPSRHSEPSENDIRFTKRLLKLSWLHEIPLVDHVILTSEGGTSMRGQKIIRYWKNDSIGRRTSQERVSPRVFVKA